MYFDSFFKIIYGKNKNSKKNFNQSDDSEFNTLIQKILSGVR